MRGAWLGPAGRIRFRDDLPEPLPKPGESLVEVVLAGVCATDLALQSGYMGFEGVPGHEFVGRALTGPLQGKRVVGEINAGCGNCPACRGEQGLDMRHCANRSVLGIQGRAGAFAERLSLPHGNLVEVPRQVRNEEAVFVEPLAAALQILEQVDLAPGTRVLVAGDGRLGLLIAKALKGAGCAVDLAGHHPERTPAGVGDRCGLLDDAHQPNPGERYQLCVEATGRPEVLGRLLPWVRPKGTVVLKTTAASDATINLAPLVIDEIQLQGSRCGRFEPALDALAHGRIEVDSMIHQSFPLAEVERAFQKAAQPGVLKILIHCQSR